MVPDEQASEKATIVVLLQERPEVTRKGMPSLGLSYLNRIVRRRTYGQVVGQGRNQLLKFRKFVSQSFAPLAFKLPSSSSCKTKHPAPMRQPCRVLLLVERPRRLIPIF